MKERKFVETGLTINEVNERKMKGQINYLDEPQTKSVKEIITGNVFTYFNFLNAILGGLVILSGLVSGRLLYSLKNCLFVGVIITNTIISIVEEIFAKKTIEKLNVIADAKIMVIRDSQTLELAREELVKDDVCIYKIGNQVVADSIILNGRVEVNESFITGEEKVILKNEGDELLSGSFIVSGRCSCTIKNVGKDNYISKISSEAKYIKQTNSIIYNSFDKLVKILSICLIPIGLLFFINQLVISSYDVADSIMSTVSALIGMIPEGLVLLTSSAMAVSVIRLRKFNVLVQELYAIENLARVDIICLDKTGTITEGTMEVQKIIALEQDEKQLREILGNYVLAMDDESVTFKALKTYFTKKNNYEVKDILPFSSVRKYSGISFKEGNFYLGSPENLLSKKQKEVEKYQEDFRVLAVVRDDDAFGVVKNATLIGLILIQDKIKANAKETLDFFRKEGVDVKIISGDNDKTVAKIAKRAGIDDLRSIDMSQVQDNEIDDIVNKYNIFGRVKPDQKKKIIMHLQEKGHFVAMTGDGVNDCLALKIADCSIAMASGSEAAKNVSQFVLLDSNIDNLPKILKEGRRSINNIERSSSLLLSKTIFTIILILTCIYFSTEYFFIPIQLTLITLFTISVPSFVLALENNNELVHGNFLRKVFLKSLPSALTVVFNIIIIYLFERQFDLDPELCTTLTVFLTATTGFIFLNSICKPYNLLRSVLMVALLVGFGYCFIFQYEFFNISIINGDTILIFIVLFICSIFIFDKLRSISNYFLAKEV